MQKKFVTNLALLLFMNLLIKPFWILGIEPAVQETVGNEPFGLYYALFNFSFLLNIFLDVGITNFNNKNIAQNNHLLAKHFSSLFTLKMVLALVYLVLTMIAGYLVGYRSTLSGLLLLLSINQFLISMVLYLRSNLLGLHLFSMDSIVSVLDRLIMISIVAVLLWGNVLKQPIDIYWFVWAQTAGYLLTAVIAFILVIGKARMRKFNWNPTFNLMILKKSFPYAILVLLMAFYNRIDAVMLERILPEVGSTIETKGSAFINGAEQAGIYAKAYRLLDATNMIAYLFSVLLLPIFSKMLKHRESVEQMVKLSYTLLITPAIIIGIGCYFYSQQLMGMLYKDHVLESAHVFGILMSCFIAISTTYVFGTLLTANGNLKELNFMAAGGMILNISLNLYLIPKFYAVGAAWASMITQFSTAIIQIILAQRELKFKINYRLIFTLLLFIVGVILINLMSQSYHFEEDPGKLNWFPNFLVMSALCVIWAFAIKLLSIKSMFKILKYG